MPENIPLPALPVPQPPSLPALPCGIKLPTLPMLPALSLSITLPNFPPTLPAGNGPRFPRIQAMIARIQKFAALCNADLPAPRA
jgi:hypothetical protein